MSRARCLKDAEARANTLVAWRERRSMDPMTAEEGVLRDEWRIRELGDPGLSYDQVRAMLLPAVEVREQILEHRYIRRGTEEPWTLFDVADAVDDLLNLIPPSAVAVSPRLLEMRGEWAAAEAERTRQLEEKRAAELALEEKRAKERRSREAFRRMAEGSEYNRALAAWWNAHVEMVNGDPELQERLCVDREFLKTADPVFAAETVPAKARAIKAHRNAWQARLKP